LQGVRIRKKFLARSLPAPPLLAMAGDDGGKEAPRATALDACGNRAHAQGLRADQQNNCVCGAGARQAKITARTQGTARVLAACSNTTPHAAPAPGVARAGPLRRARLAG